MILFDRITIDIDLNTGFVVLEDTTPLTLFKEASDGQAASVLLSMPKLAGSA